MNEYRIIKKKTSGRFPRETSEVTIVKNEKEEFVVEVVRLRISGAPHKWAFLDKEGEYDLDKLIPKEERGKVLELIEKYKGALTNSDLRKELNRVKRELEELKVRYGDVEKENIEIRRKFEEEKRTRKIQFDEIGSLQRQISEQRKKNKETEDIFQAYMKGIVHITCLIGNAKN